MHIPNISQRKMGSEGATNWDPQPHYQVNVETVVAWCQLCHMCHEVRRRYGLNEAAANQQSGPEPQWENWSFLPGKGVQINGQIVNAAILSYVHITQAPTISTKVGIESGHVAICRQYRASDGHWDFLQLDAWNPRWVNQPMVSLLWVLWPASLPRASCSRNSEVISGIARKINLPGVFRICPHRCAMKLPFDAICRYRQYWLYLARGKKNNCN